MLSSTTVVFRDDKTLVAQSVGSVEYTDCTSAEWLDTPNECPEYDTKQSDGVIPVMLEL